MVGITSRNSGWWGGPDAARARLVDGLRDSGRLTDRALETAFRAVPRHVFLPAMPAADAYQDEAFVVKTGPDGLPLSSSSQPAIMAIMLEQLGIAPGQRVLEIGTGTGYNAALMTHLVGERGTVVTMDIDPDLVGKARANLDGAGYPDVILVCGDGGFGEPGHAPYDRIIVTAGAWDLAPDWLRQLGPGGRIVLPLSVRGIQLSVALEREAGHWRSRSAFRCGFIRMAGAFAGPESFLPLGPQPGLHMHTDDGRPVDAAALYAALGNPATDVPSGVAVSGLGELGEADLWLTVTQPDLVRLDHHGRGADAGHGAAAGAAGRDGRARRRAGRRPAGRGARGGRSAAGPADGAPGAAARRVRGRRPGVRGPRPTPGRAARRAGRGLGRAGPARERRG